MSNATLIKHTVALSLLFASALNPRKYFNQKGIDELAASIFANGVVQSLTARPVGDKYEVVAGGRRLRALQQLQAQGQIPDDYEVPVQIRELTDAEALAVAIAENNDREDIHPMEEADAWALLERELGLDPEQIALRTGKHRTYVKQQLQLAKRASDTTRFLFLNDYIDHSQAAALTVLPPEDQEVFLKGRVTIRYADEDLEDGQPKPGAKPNVSGFLGTAAAIRKAAKEGGVEASRALFSVEDYRKAGGKVTENIFGEDFLDNPDLFMRMQQEAVDALTVSYGEQGLTPHRVEEMPEFDKYSTRKGHVTLYLDETGRLHTWEDTGPKVYAVEATQIDANGKIIGFVNADGKTAKATVNRKRQRLEDKAINRAAEYALMSSWRRAMEFFVLSVLGLEGTRIRVDHPWANPHTGYHDPKAVAEVEKFHESLVKRGLKLGESHGHKEGDPIHYLASSSPANLNEAREVIVSYTDKALQKLVHAFMALMLAPIPDGRQSKAHNYLLEDSKPDMTKFFTPTGEYLQTLKNSEIEEVITAIGEKSAGKRKTDNVPYVLGMPAYKSYMPDRLKNPVAHGTSILVDEPPFDPDEMEDEEEFADAA